MITHTYTSSPQGYVLEEEDEELKPKPTNSLQGTIWKAADSSKLRQETDSDDKDALCSIILEESVVLQLVNIGMYM